MENKGYTLIEVLVGVLLFTIIIGGPTGFFISSVRSQRRILLMNKMINNTSYNLEYLSRTLRMAAKDLDGSCISAKKNYENPQNKESAIRFLNYNNICQEFSLSNGQLVEKKSTDNNKNNLGAPLSLTPEELEISQLKFILSGEDQDDDLQPKVTIFLEIKKRGQAEPKILIQTTVSQRNLDVSF